MSITTDAAYVFRDKITPGSPIKNNPSKALIRELFSDIDANKSALNLKNGVTMPALSDSAEQPAAGTYLRPRVINISDMAGIYDDDPDGDNTDAFEALVNESTDGLASGHIAIPYKTRIVTGGQILPAGTTLTSIGNADISLVGSSTWGGPKAALIYADPVVYSSPGVVNVAATIAARNTFKGIDLTESEGTVIDGINLFRDSVMTDPTTPEEYMKRVFRATNISEAVSGWATIPGWSGDAITCDSAPGVKIRNVTVCGWNKAAVIAGCERFEVEGLRSDCNNGLDINNIFDASWADKLSFYPAFAAGWLRDYLGADPGFGNPGYAEYLVRRALYDQCLMRSGTGLYLHEAAPSTRAGDGVMVSRMLAIGYAVKGLHVEDANACMFDKVWIDNIYSQMNTTHPYLGMLQPIGLATEGDCQNTQFSNVHVDSNYFNYALLHAGGTVGPLVDTCSSGQAYQNQLVLGQNRGSIDGFQYAGNAADCAVLMQSGIDEWSLENIRGVNVTTTPAVYKMDVTTGRTDMRKLRIGDWTHNGVSVDTREFATYVDLRLTTDQPITAGASNYTKAAWNSELRDSLAEASSGTITVSCAGEYDIEWVTSLNCTSATAGYQGSVLYLNGTRNGEPNLRYLSVIARQSFSGRQRISLAAGDTIEVWPILEAGGSIEADYSYVRVYRIPDRRC